MLARPATQTPGSYDPPLTSLQYAATLLVIASVYFGAAKLGLTMAFLAEQVTAVWPPTGIALAAVLLLGYRVWPAIWLGALLANATANEPLLTACGIATGNTLEAVTGAWLCRIAGFGRTLDRLKDVVGFVVLAAIGSTTVSATIGTTSLTLTGVQPWTAFADIWWVWWVGDAMGDLVMAPVLLTWATRMRRSSSHRLAEGLGLVALLVAATVMVFVSPFTSMPSDHPLEYIVFPFVIWGALRFGELGTANVTFIASVVAIWGTAHESGPFATGNMDESLILLQLFMGVVAVSGLLLAAAVAERREAEEAARLNEERLRLALNAAHMGNWDFNILTGEVQGSDTLEGIHGLPPGRLRGTFGAYLDYVHPNDRERVKETIAPSVETGADYDVEYRILRPDGSVRWLHGRGRVIRDHTGRALRMAGVCMEVTARKHAEEALRDSEERLKGIIESAMDAVITIDEDERIALFNPAAERMFRCKSSEIIGARLERFIPVAVREVHHRHVRQFGETGVTSRTMGVQRTLSALRADGEEFPMEATISQTRVAGQKLYTVIIRDVTERVRAERERDRLLAREQAARAEVEAANLAKDEFLAMLGHELRNPLGAISNAVAVLGQIGKQEEEAVRFRTIIARQTQRLARLVNDLLDVSRVTTGKIMFDRRPVDLAEVAKDCVAALCRAGRGTQHNVRLRVEAVQVDGDPTRLEQVVTNILENALKFTPSGGCVEVSVARDGDEAVLRVTDSGIGISPEMLPRVFDIFTQERQSLDRSRGGLGLGLTLVKRLVELHGGSVAAHSDGPGHGSEFVVRLPMVNAPASSPQKVALPDVPPRRVLIIEDQEDAREALHRLLDLYGHRVEQAEDGVRGLDRLLDSRPEIAFIDIGLPGLDGYAIAQAVRAAPGGDAVYLVAVTGYGQREDRRRILAAGFNAHLVKPVEPKALLQALAAAGADS